jgi:hypothetical protein
MPESDVSYDRGRIDGEVRARLGSHDTEIAAIKRALTTVTQDIGSLVLATQHLNEAAQAEREKVVATAKALAEAESARRDKDKARWTPIERFTAVIASVVGLTGWIYLIAHIVTGA